MTDPKGEHKYRKNFLILRINIGFKLKPILVVKLGWAIFLKKLSKHLVISNFICIFASSLTIKAIWAMVKKFENLVETISTEIGKDMLISKKNDMIMLFLNVYNRFQEDERDGADYIFNLNEKDDLMICIDWGLKLNDIASLAQQKATYIMFGVNHTEPSPIKTMEELASILYAHANEVVTYAFAYVTRCEEYQALYEEYVTSRIEKGLLL